MVSHGLSSQGLVSLHLFDADPEHLLLIKTELPKGFKRVVTLSELTQLCDKDKRLNSMLYSGWMLV
jgi:hypothetical protein